MGRSACSSLAETLGVKSPASVKSSDPTGTGAAEIPQEDGSVLSQISQHLNIVAQSQLIDM